jgi:hypothetical protein
VAVWETCQGRTEEMAPPIAFTRVVLVVEAGVAVLPEEEVEVAVGANREPLSLLVPCASWSTLRQHPLYWSRSRSGARSGWAVSFPGLSKAPLSKRHRGGRHAFRIGPPFENPASKFRTPDGLRCPYQLSP